MNWSVRPGAPGVFQKASSFESVGLDGVVVSADGLELERDEEKVFVVGMVRVRLRSRVSFCYDKWHTVSGTRRRKGEVVWGKCREKATYTYPFPEILNSCMGIPNPLLLLGSHRLRVLAFICSRRVCILNL